MIHGIRLDKGECIVELGPGTGAFTSAIREILPDPGLYLGIERQPGFVRLLRERFPDMNFVEGSAEEADQHHAAAGLPRVRAVLSGLPFGSLPAQISDRVIASATSLLGPHAEFRTFQYVHAYPLHTAIGFRRRMSESLGPCQRSRAVLWNLPPAYVLTWTV